MKIVDSWKGWHDCWFRNWDYVSHSSSTWLESKFCFSQVSSKLPQPLMMLWICLNYYKLLAWNGYINPIAFSSSLTKHTPSFGPHFYDSSLKDSWLWPARVGHHTVHKHHIHTPNRITNIINKVATLYKYIVYSFQHFDYTMLAFIRANNVSLTDMLVLVPWGRLALPSRNIGINNAFT